MAQNITRTLELLTRQNEVRPNLVLCIDGFDVKFSTAVTSTTVNYGDSGRYYGEPGLLYGRPFPDQNILDIIDLSGTTRNITQQLNQDKGSVASISNMKISMLDIDGYLTKLFQPGNIVPDMIARECEVFYGAQEGSFPDDYISLYRGLIDGVSFDAGLCSLRIVHPDKLKRTEIFSIAQTELISAINNSQTSIEVNDSTGFIEPLNELRSFIIIDDEWMEVSSIAGNIFTVTRGAFGTIPASHDDETEVNAAYRLTDNGIDLALRVMLSGGEEFIFENEEVIGLGFTDSLTPNVNAVLFSDGNIQKKYKLNVGDLLTISGTTQDFTDQPIVGFGTSSGSSFILVDIELAQEPSLSANGSAKSQFNTLPDGLGMKTTQVDVERHLFIKDLFGSSFPTMEVDILEDITGVDFLHKELYFPNGLYAIPRGGVSSVNLTVPPLSSDDTVTFNENNVINADKIKISRQASKYLYSSVRYLFNQDPVEEKFINKQITVSGDSLNRIPIKNQVLEVEAKGFRRNTETRQLIERQSIRFLDRYQFAAAFFTGVTVSVATGFNIDVGDVVLFDGRNLQVSDDQSGEKGLQPRLFEVINKSFSIQSGKYSFDILDTNFSTAARYGVISPTSNVQDGSTSSSIKIASSFYTAGSDETYKWVDSVGEKLLIHNADYSQSAEVTLLQISETEPNTLLVSALPFTPDSTFFVNIATYGNGASSENSTHKNIYCFVNPTEEITAVTDSSNFEVTNIDRFFIGCTIQVNSVDFSIETQETTVVDIQGNQITTAAPLSTLPSVGDLVQFIGFSNDNGPPYRMI